MNNKKTFRWTKLLLIPSVLVTLFVIARLFNWIQYYKLPTSNMEPTYKVGDIVFGSNLLNADANDVIAYMAEPSIFDEEKKKYLAIARIVGVENDTIEIKNGILYRNGKLADDTLKFAYWFVINNKYTQTTFSRYEHEHNMYPFTDSSMLINFSYSKLNDSKLLSFCKRRIDTNTLNIDPIIFGEKYTHSKWSTDNFGPVIVPAGQLFLLGDNRGNSVDSRIRGFISKEQFRTKIFR